MILSRYRTSFSSPQGTGSVEATDLGLCKVCLPGDSAVGSLGSNVLPSSPLTNQAAQLLHEYFLGKKVEFNHLPLDLDGISSFRTRILLLTRLIPYGETWSYGQLADRAGFKKGARAVGGAMAINPLPVIIPCHRVVSAKGSLTGYSATGGIVFKKYLLTMEHVEFIGERILK